jgi:hypothetical protein
MDTDIVLSSCISWTVLGILLCKLCLFLDWCKIDRAQAQSVYLINILAIVPEIVVRVPIQPRTVYVADEYVIRCAFTFKMFQNIYCSVFNHFVRLERSIELNVGNCASCGYMITQDARDLNTE